MSLPKDPRKCVQDAWYKLLVDFRAWYMPETQQTSDWKQRPIAAAIKSCKARLLDDSEGMLAEYRKSQNAEVVGGASAFMPIMLTATAAIDQPPDSSQLTTMPYFVDVIINDKLAKIRLIPKTIRAQIAFYATNPHDASSVADQFCAYMDDMNKRRISVGFPLSDGFIQKSTFTILDNQLFPTPVPSEALNITIFTIDVSLVGHVPQVIGLGGDFDATTANGYNPDGSPVEKPFDIPVVVQADSFNQNDGSYIRVLADLDTGIVTDGIIDD